MNRLPFRHRYYGRYYGIGITEDYYGEDKENWKDKAPNLRNVMLPDGKGQGEYIRKMAGEVKIYKLERGATV
jgi:hypothetical protein